MGLHGRLGAESPVALAGPDLLRHICALARPPLLATGAWDGSARLWDAETGQCVRSFCASAAVRCCVATRAYVFTGSHDCAVRMWRVDSGRCERVLRGHTHWVVCMQHLPARGVVATGSRDRSVRVWSTTTGTCLGRWDAHMWAVWCLAATPDQRLLLSGGGDCAIRVWDAAEWGAEARPPLVGHTAAVQALRVGGAGGGGQGERLLVSAAGAGDATVRLWDLAAGTCLRTLAGHQGIVWGAALVADAGLLGVVSVSDDGSVREWDTASGRCTRRLNASAATSQIFGLVVLEGRDKDLAIALDGRPPVPVVRSAGPYTITTPAPHAAAAAATDCCAADAHQPSPEGARLMVTVGADRQVTLWDYPRAQPLRQLGGHTDAVSCISIIEDPEFG